MRPLEACSDRDFCPALLYWAILESTISCRRQQVLPVPGQPIGIQGALHSGGVEELDRETCSDYAVHDVSACLPACLPACLSVCVAVSVSVCLSF